MPDTRYRETAIWDTVTHTDPVAAGAEFRYFTDNAGKTRWQQNFDNERRIPKGSIWDVWAIRVATPDAGVTPADFTLFHNSAHLTFLVSEQDVFSAPCWALPQGGGLHFYSPEAAATTDNIANGVQSADAVHRRQNPIRITGDDTYEAVIHYGAAVDGSASVVVQVVLEVEIQEIVRA